eukprot:3862196-Pleurochrysis_carterae.AAC.2
MPLWPSNAACPLCVRVWMASQLLGASSDGSCLFATATSGQLCERPCDGTCLRCHTVVVSFL